MSSLTRVFALGLFAMAVAVAVPLMGGTAQVFDRTWTECVGDLNGDNHVDLTDLATLLGSYGLCIGHLDYNPYADIDASGCVNLSDLAALLAAYGADCTIAGDNCDDPVRVTLTPADLPYWDINTTCGRGNDYQDTCLGDYDQGEDIIYELTVPYDMGLGITLDPMGTAWSGVAISDTCPAGSSCIDYSCSSSGEPHGIDSVVLPAGTYYIMVDTWPLPDCIPEFMLTLEETLHAIVDCPPDGVMENEPCGDSYNSGCYMDVPHFEPLTCGETVCGTVWAGGGFRDPDWYEVTVDDWTRFTFEFLAEFDALIGLVETDPPGSGDCADISGSLVPYDTGPFGELLSVETDYLPPGTYWFYVSHADLWCAPCGEWSDYVATLTCETMPEPGDNCDNPLQITLSSQDLPYAEVNTTCGRGNDYEGTCLWDFDTGEDLIYELTILETMEVDIVVNPHFAYWTAVAVSETCPPGDTCLAYTCGHSDVRIIPSFALDPGVYYVMVDSQAPDCISDLTLIIRDALPCNTDCPPGADVETEACGEDLNAGCGADPPVFEPLTCGETVCGTIWAEDYMRDTDWYEVTVTEATRFTWHVASDFPVAIGLVETDPPGSGDCCDMTGILDPWAIDSACADVAVTTDLLPPGIYWFHISHREFYCDPCGQRNDYVATLTCETLSGPGDNCDDPAVVTLSYDNLPCQVLGTTCGRGNDYENTCLGQWDGGEDLICEVHVLDEMVIEMVMHAFDTGWTGVAIDDTCPPGDSCLAYSTAGSDEYWHHTEMVHLMPGTYYVIVDTRPSPDCIPVFELIFDYPPP